MTKPRTDCATCGHHASAHQWNPSELGKLGPADCRVPGCSCARFHRPVRGQRRIKVPELGRVALSYRDSWDRGYLLLREDTGAAWTVKRTSAPYGVLEPGDQWANMNPGDPYHPPTEFPSHGAAFATLSRLVGRLVRGAGEVNG